LRCTRRRPVQGWASAGERWPLDPVGADARLAEEKRHQLDRLYQRIVNDLDALLHAVGLKTAA
jgi:hypothetical protein